MDNIKFWSDECDRYLDKSVLRILVGIKCDLNGKRECGKRDVMELANQLRVQNFEVSSKCVYNVDNVIHTMIQSIVEYGRKRKYYVAFFLTTGELMKSKQ